MLKARACLGTKTLKEGRPRHICDGGGRAGDLSH